MKSYIICNMKLIKKLALSSQTEQAQENKNKIN